MALTSINKTLTNAQKTAVNTAFTHLTNYMIGTNALPGLLVIYTRATPNRKALLRSHNIILDQFLTLLEKANIYI